VSVTTQDQREANLIAIDTIIARRRERAQAARRPSRAPRLRDQIMTFFSQHSGFWSTAEVGEALGRPAEEIAARVTELVREGLLVAVDLQYRRA
jgi:hypothetical protein